jgi:hypothetical protein
MARRWWIWLLAVAALPLLGWWFDRSQMVGWVGGTDLEIEFVVTEAGSATPIPGARIEVQSEGGFYEERDKQEFVLVCDVSGVARKVCRKSMCSGKQSGLLFTNTFAVPLPWWRFRVSAPGFQPSEWVDLNAVEYIRQVQRPGTQHKARLVVRVSLRKNAT